MVLNSKDGSLFFSLLVIILGLSSLPYAYELYEIIFDNLKDTIVL